jgi:hypothetical protein
MEFDSNQEIANAYGLPYMFEEADDYVMEEPDVSLKRIVGMNKVVSRWIERHRRIPSSNPNAQPEERKMGIWLKVLMFYSDVMVDPTDENKKEREENETCHKSCQFTIRSGCYPDSKDEEFN